MSSILKVDTIQDQDGNNIINESANTITIGASGDTITIPSGATLANSGIVTGFESTGIDDNATSTAITIDSSERVGIGTSSPNGNLHVAGGEIFFKNDAGNCTVSIGASDSGNSIINLGDPSDGDVGRILYEHANNSLSFKVNASERMRINSSGSVGIGTSSPINKLTVNGSSRVTGEFLVTDGTVSGATSKISMDVNSGGNGLARIRSSLNSGGTTLPLAFFTSASEVMRYDTSGNVGINTSSPSSTLDVNGSIRGDLELAPGKQYSMTSGSGTGTAIFDTNISLATFGILEVFYRANANQGGTASYQQTGLYYIQIGTGFNGAIRTTISQTEVFKHVPYGSPGALTFSSVIFDGSSEVSAVTSTAGCQIRIKIAGYNTSHTGAGTSLRIRRIF